MSQSVREALKEAYVEVCVLLDDINQSMDLRAAIDRQLHPEE